LVVCWCVVCCVLGWVGEGGLSGEGGGEGGGGGGGECMVKSVRETILTPQKSPILHKHTHTYTHTPIKRALCSIRLIKQSELYFTKKYLQSTESAL